MLENNGKLAFASLFILFFAFALRGYFFLLFTSIFAARKHSIHEFFVFLSKPGSVTLHQWQQLAKPNLGGILHPRPGVLTKDFRELEVDIQHVYSLNDLEEDEPDLSHLSGAHSMGKTPVKHTFRTLLSPIYLVLPLHVNVSIHVSLSTSLCSLLFQ